MRYIRWGNRFDAPLVSRLGFGTTRFLQEDLKNRKGLSRCIGLVKYAIEKGINYFDVAPTYSNGMAEQILGAAFDNISKPVYVAAKTGLIIDKTADDVLKRIDASLRVLNKDIIDFYHVWSVMNWEQYETVRSSGGILDGVIKAKEQGLIKHICISLHCDPATTMRIMDDEIFEGITISLNALNYRKWETVLAKAADNKIAIATMNSLAGGLIPIYEKLFAGLDNSNDSVPVKALRFVMRLPGVHVAHFPVCRPKKSLMKIVWRLISLTI